MIEPKTLHAWLAPNGRWLSRSTRKFSSTGGTIELDLTARMDLPKLIQTFISPAVLLPKEASRYTYLFESMDPFEALLWIVAIPAFFALRNRPDDISSKWLIAAGMVGGAIIFNGASLLYAAPILPVFIPALASLITHGFGPDERVSWRSVSPATCIAISVTAAVFTLGAISQPYQDVDELGFGDSSPALVRQAEQVKALASTGCIIAGPSELYVQHFMQYPGLINQL